MAGALVVDVRAPDRFARAHVPGTLNIPWGGSFTTLAGSLLPYDHDLYLLSDNRENAIAAGRALTLIGLDRIAGIFNEDACIAWVDGGRALGRIRQFTPETLLEQVRRQYGDADECAIEGRVEERPSSRGGAHPARRAPARAGDASARPRDRGVLPARLALGRGGEPAVGCGNRSGERALWMGRDRSRAACGGAVLTALRDARLMKLRKPSNQNIA